MPTIAEQRVDIEQRIVHLAKGADDLRQQMVALDKTTIQYIRLNDLLLMGERRLAAMRAEREALVGVIECSTGANGAAERAR